MPDGTFKLTEDAARAELQSRRLAAKSLHEFTRQAWPWVEPGKPFQDNWHIGALSEHLQAVTDGQIRNLGINFPPRSMKSTGTSIMFPAYVWTRSPFSQFLYTSYSSNLSIRDTVRFRRLVTSGWYRARWGQKFTLAEDQNTKTRIENSENGYRIASSVDGTNTGEGGDYLVYDDPNSAADTSDTMLDNAISWFDGVMATRLNDPKTGHHILIQQRLHERDLTGHILGKGDKEWVWLILPMEHETARRCVTVALPSTNGKPWRDPRTKEGELLWPERFGDKELARLKKALGGQYAISGQLQQNPAPSEGGLIRKKWWRWWKEPKPPACEMILQSWDTAMSKREESAFTACTTWGVFRDENKVPQIILLSMWRDRVEWPELRAMAQRLSIDYRDHYESPLAKKDPKCKPTLILVEAKMSGISLIQSLRRAGVMVMQFNPTGHGDKINRARLITHIIEGGRAWVRAAPPNYDRLHPIADTFVNACAMFPKGTSKDVVDTMSQSFKRLIDSGFIYSSDEQGPGEPQDLENRESFY